MHVEPGSGEIECERKKREKDREKVESGLGYSFCHCCMMFNMPDRGRLAEVLYPGQNAAELRSLDGKSCLHPIFHFAHSPLFFICIHIQALLLLHISPMIIC